MNYKEIIFELDPTQKLYRSYMKRVEKTVKVLHPEDANDLLLEINSHIHEGMNADTLSGESEKLIEVLDRLGAPEEYLQTEVAKKKLHQATRTFHPKDIFQALRLNLANGLKFSVFSILYLSLAAFFVIIFAKLIYPQKTGLFMKNGDFHSFGFVKYTQGAQEILGYWIIPISLITCLLCYILITVLMRMSK